MTDEELIVRVVGDVEQYRRSMQEATFIANHAIAKVGNATREEEEKIRREVEKTLVAKNKSSSDWFEGFTRAALGVATFATANQLANTVMQEQTAILTHNLARLTEIAAKNREIQQFRFSESDEEAASRTVAERLQMKNEELKLLLKEEAIQASNFRKAEERKKELEFTGIRAPEAMVPNSLRGKTFGILEGGANLLDQLGILGAETAGNALKMQAEAAYNEAKTVMDTTAERVKTLRRQIQDIEEDDARQALSKFLINEQKFQEAIGQGRAGIRLHALDNINLSESQKEVARTAAEKTIALQEVHQEFERMSAEADRIREREAETIRKTEEEAMAPIDKFQARVKELNTMREAGLSAEAYAFQLEKAKMGLVSVHDAANMTRQAVLGVDAAMSGSAQAGGKVSQYLNSLRGQSLNQSPGGTGLDALRGIGSNSSSEDIKKLLKEISKNTAQMNKKKVIEIKPANVTGAGS